MNGRGRLWAVAGLVGGLFTPHSGAFARPASRPQVAVLPVVVEGELESEVRDRINEKVRTTLEGETYQLVSGSAPGGRCADAACIHQVAENANARFVVIPAVGTITHDYAIAVRLYDFAGQLAAVKESTCEICSYDEVVSEVGAQAEQMVESLAHFVENPYGDRGQEQREVEGPAELWVQTSPSGAEVRVDGTLLGKTPLRVEVEPGLRDMEIVRRGHFPVSRTVRAYAGQTSELRLDLVENSDRQEHAMKASAWSLAAGSLALLGAGAALLVIDERPYRARESCTDGNLDYAGRCRYRYDTLAGGAVLTALGVASAAASVSLAVVLYGKKRGRRGSNQAFPDEAKVSIQPWMGGSSAGVRVGF